MRVDLDVESAGLDGLPRFQRAAFHARRLLRLAYGLAGLGLFAFILALFVMLFSSTSLWSAVLVNNAAALWLVAAGLQSAYWIARWRAKTLGAEQGAGVVEPPPEEDESGPAQAREEGLAAVGRGERAMSPASRRRR